jgi:DNA polymerase III alpha subunit
MIPLFKSQFSIGKSILTAEKILDIAKTDQLGKVVLLEDTFYGFRVFNKLFQEEEVPFVFGLKISVLNTEGDYSEKPSKLALFAKNNEGIRDLKRMYSNASLNDRNSLILSEYNKTDFKNLKVCVPFYDSYIFNNLFYFGLSHIDIKDLDPVYFIEDNNHPFDFQIKSIIDSLDVKTQTVKTILHRDKDDFAALQMYKAACNRSGGRTPTFQNPNLNHFCSDEFCWESYKDATT